MMIREATCADVAGIARVHVDSWRTTYPGLIPDAVLAGLSYADRERLWTRALCEADSTTCVYVAVDPGGEIVGFASGGPARPGDPAYPAELYAIYLLAAAQGQGLGRRLVGAVAARLQTAGYPALIIWVLASNPARQFYEALGGRLVRRQPITIGGAALEEVAYGWPDLGVLAGGAAGAP